MNSSLESSFADFRMQLTQKLQTLSTVPLKQLAPTEKLLSTGLIDSMTIVDILEFIEQYWRFDVDPSELSIDNFDSIAAIETYVRGKLGA